MLTKRHRSLTIKKKKEILLLNHFFMINVSQMLCNKKILTNKKYDEISNKILTVEKTRENNSIRRERNIKSILQNKFNYITLYQ